MGTPRRIRPCLSVGHQSPGRIADLLKSKRQTEEALRIWTEQCLPVLRKARDSEGISSILFSCAKTRIGHGGWLHGEAQTILDELEESFALVKTVRSARGIALVGSLFGRVLAQAKRERHALEVLEEAAVACEELNWRDQLAQVRELQTKIREKPEQLP